MKRRSEDEKKRLEEEKRKYEEEKRRNEDYMKISEELKNSQEMLRRVIQENKVLHERVSRMERHPNLQHEVSGSSDCYCYCNIC